MEYRPRFIDRVTNVNGCTVLLWTVACDQPLDTADSILVSDPGDCFQTHMQCHSYPCLSLLLTDFICSLG